MPVPIPVPSAGSVSGPRPRLTIGMATYDDFDGAYFTAAALRLYHPEVTERTEILVVDNNPYGPAAWPLKQLEADVPRLRYLPVDDITTPAVKDRVVREASGDWVLVLDSHVMLAPGALARLLDFIDADPGSDDLLQGPLLYRGGHFPEQLPEWEGTLFGRWTESRLVPGFPDPDGPPVEIGMQGLGLFACRRASWAGYSPLFRGHGAEEGYLHERYRALGRRVRCLPFLAWEHRFGRALTAPYHPSDHDRIRNYLIAFEEMGRSAQEVVDHFRVAIDPAVTDRVAAAWEREKSSAFAAFPAIAVLDPDRDDMSWRKSHDHVAEFGVAGRLRRITCPRDTDIPVDTDRDVVRALAHRRLLGRALAEGWESLLVLDLDTRFATGVEEEVAAATSGDWQAADLSGAQDTALLGPAGDRTGEAVALAYHRSAYHAALTAIPSDPADLRAALTRAGGSLSHLLRACLPTMTVHGRQTDEDSMALAG